jgi:trk system potassium uptake protein TrkA
MKQFAVIGLGNFGFTIACELSHLGHDVIAIDKNEHLINKIKESVTHAIIADAKQIEDMGDFINNNLDAVILNLGESLEDTIIVTLALKKSGVSNIIVKVSSDEHGMIMEKLGISDIIIPEKDYAAQMAKKLTNENLLDYLPLSPEYGIYEIAIPDKFSGKRLNELNLRRKYHVSLIAVKDIMRNSMIINPDPDFRFIPDMVLYLLGKNSDVLNLKAG